MLSPLLTCLQAFTLHE